MTEIETGNMTEIGTRNMTEFEDWNTTEFEDWNTTYYSIENVTTSTTESTCVDTPTENTRFQLILVITIAVAVQILEIAIFVVTIIMCYIRVKRGGRKTVSTGIWYYILHVYTHSVHIECKPDTSTKVTATALATQIPLVTNTNHSSTWATASRCREASQRQNSTAYIPLIHSIP